MNRHECGQGQPMLPVVVVHHVPKVASRSDLIPLDTVVLYNVTMSHSCNVTRCSIWEVSYEDRDLLGRAGTEGHQDGEV